MFVGCECFMCVCVRVCGVWVWCVGVGCVWCVYLCCVGVGVMCV